MLVSYQLLDLSGTPGNTLQSLYGERARRSGVMNATRVSCHLRRVTYEQNAEPAGVLIRWKKKDALEEAGPAGRGSAVGNTYQLARGRKEGQLRHGYSVGQNSAWGSRDG